MLFSLVSGILHLSEIPINCMNEYYIFRGIFFQIFSLKDLSNISQESTVFRSMHGFPESFNLLYALKFSVITKY